MSFGKNISISIFGESHGNGIGTVIEGLPSGIKLDMDEIAQEMKRRAPGQNKLSTTRKEADSAQIQSGVFEGYTTGTPLAAVIANNDTHSKDYSILKTHMRPGHADYAGSVRYSGFNDYRGGGHFSGRLTAPLVFAGAIAKQVLKSYGVTVGAHISQIEHVRDANFDPVNVDATRLHKLLAKELPVIDDTKIDAIKEAILNAKNECDSVGGKIECAIVGLKAGIGNPFFDSLESTIAHLAFSVPAVKAISFGIGEQFAHLRGTVANDSYHLVDNNIKTKTNNNGGITGGISTGMPVIFETVIKPTPSISQQQQTVNIKDNIETTLKIEGRHDPCIVQRAVVVIEAIAAIAVLELWR
ncbi:MAG: chorismate synthase [Epulopiscium sp. Nele67-Bin002]|nr:MAG: chorismate synthase [Epulopiscium sp. Nuni2H_MBin001]OON92589.1 MAG: chorismate synthase [Epulopiscium sp. Nele67-Bin002]